MSPNKAQVAEADVEVLEDETLDNAAEVSEEVTETPESQQPIDVEKIRAEYEQRLAQSTRDLNAMKSSLQKREAELTSQYEKQKADLQKQLRDIRLGSMDENQRKVYEQQAAQEEVENLARRAADAEQAAQEMARTLDAQAFFVQRGVPADKLVMGQGYDALVNSGWSYIDQELTTLRKSAQSQTPAKPRKTAPTVDTNKGIPGSKTSWADLRKRYGSEEHVYQMIEQGLLDPSILPS